MLQEQMLTLPRSHSQSVGDPEQRSSQKGPSFLIQQLLASELQTVQKYPQKLWIILGKGCKSYTHAHTYYWGVVKVTHTYTYTLSHTCTWVQMYTSIVHTFSNAHTATTLHHLGPRILTEGNKRMKKGQISRHTYRKAGAEWSGFSCRETSAPSEV